MKRRFLIILLILFSSTLFCSEYIKKYSAIKKWDSATENLGNSIYELKLKEKTGTEIKAELFHTVTPFSQVILNEINLKLNNGKYEFSFVDGWNNRAFGWIVFNNDYLELYLDCNEFDEQGKNVARLYGETIRLYETTKDKDFINNAIESDYSVKKILNNYNSGYFPLEKDDVLLSVIYIGTIDNIKIYKTNLLWNIHSSRRMTHRLVFIKNENVIGIYGGIQSDKIVINNNKIIFEDLNKNNIIEINKKIPEEVFIDGETFSLEK